MAKKAQAGRARGKASAKKSGAGAASKKAASKPTAKGTAKKKSAAKRSATGEKAAKTKKTARSSSTKKSTAAKVTKKTASKKTGSKAAKKTATRAAKKASTKTVKKPAAKAATKPTKKPSASSSPTKKTAKAKAVRKTEAPKGAVKKTGRGATTARATDRKSAPKSGRVEPGASANSKAATGGQPEAGGAADTAKSKRKGITIVSNRPAKKPRSPKVTTTLPRPDEPLLGPGAKQRAPLIPSAPRPDTAGDGDQDRRDEKIKSPFNKRELRRFREMLVGKRAELLGDIQRMESEALPSASTSNGGGAAAASVNEPESYDVSLDLAAADRKLIREIDDALARIDEGTYGICAMLGKPIKTARLEELPWTRYSIEAARALERGGGTR